MGFRVWVSGLGLGALVLGFRVTWFLIGRSLKTCWYAQMCGMRAFWTCFGAAWAYNEKTLNPKPFILVN